MTLVSFEDGDGFKWMRRSRAVVWMTDRDYSLCMRTISQERRRMPRTCNITRCCSADCRGTFVVQARNHALLRTSGDTRRSCGRWIGRTGKTPQCYLPCAEWLGRKARRRSQLLHGAIKRCVLPEQPIGTSQRFKYGRASLTDFMYTESSWSLYTSR
jgi:hypothetical protein